MYSLVLNCEIYIREKDKINIIKEIFFYDRFYFLKSAWIEERLNYIRVNVVILFLRS